jgi:effector-binding domain-containing protein
MEEIQIIEVLPQLVLGMRQKGAYRDIPAMLGELYIYGISHQSVLTGPPVFICHEGSVEEAMVANETGDADMEVAFPIKGSIEGEGPISIYELPGGRMAKVLHRGPYEGCGPTYTRLFAWIEEQGLAVAGPVREVYLNDPTQVKPEELMTEIYVPI